MSKPEEKVALALKLNKIEIISMKKKSDDEIEKILKKQAKSLKNNSIVAFSELPPNKILKNNIMVKRETFLEAMNELHIELSEVSFEVEDLLSKGVKLSTLKADFVLMKKDNFGNISFYIIEPGDLHHVEVQCDNYQSFARQIMFDLAKEKASLQFNVGFYAFTTSKYDSNFELIKTRVENFLKEVLH